MRAIDHAIFYAINRWPDALSPFFVGLSECTKWLPMRIFLVLLFLGMVWQKSTRRTAILTIIAFPLANETTDIFKASLRVLRPCVELPDVILRVEKLTSFGTASAHSANMAAVATVFWWTMGWRWGLPWAIIAFLTGISRVFVGVHYPTQVVFGWTCGIAIASAVIAVAEAIKKRRTPTAEPSVES